MAKIHIRENNDSGSLEVVSNFRAGSSVSFGKNVAGTAQSTAALLGANIKSSYLEGIFDDKDPKSIHAIYRDIYLHDPISGSAVDLRATLPWSEFSLIGADKEIIDVMRDNIDRLNLQTLHIEMCIDQLVSGAFIGSLCYNKQVKGFTDIIPWDYSDCELEETPLYGVQPRIHVTIPTNVKQFVMSTDKDNSELQKRIPEDLLKSMQNYTHLKLNELETIFLPRRTISTMQTGISLYRRILPIYLLERLLYRGTVTEASKRQRSTMHITMGDEEWIPTESDMNNIVSLFQTTEQDPLSSIVATRNSVQVSEVRSAGDFWKWTDIIDQLNTLKLQGLGINEGFLSGDTTYQNMEAALSVFVEDLRAYRERMTKNLYYKKIFPLISQLNDFRHKEEDGGQRKSFDQNDPKNLIIPEISWHKTLRPEADQDFLGILDTLADKGVPIPIRMWASAGGVNLDNLLGDLKEDQVIKKQIAEAQGKKEGDGDDDNDFFSALNAGKRRKRRGNILDRDYGDTFEVVGRTKTGKKKHIRNQRRQHQKANEVGAKALSRLAKRYAAKDKNSNRNR